MKNIKQKLEIVIETVVQQIQTILELKEEKEEKEKLIEALKSIARFTPDRSTQATAEEALKDAKKL